MYNIFQILFDYEIRNQSLNFNALFDKWPQMKGDVLASVNPADRDGLLKLFDEEIGYFLALMKLLAPSKSNFTENIGKFIIFSNASITIYYLNEFAC